MKHHAVRLALLVCLLALTGCTQISIAEQEQLRSTTTAVADTAVPATIIAEAPTEAPTAAPTSAPTAEPSPTPEPQPTPLGPTPLPDPELQGFGLCNQTAGDVAGGRFSAQVTAITTTVEAKFDRLEFALNVPQDSVAPHATARCLTTVADALETGAVQSGQGYVLLVGLNDWLQDDLFKSSIVTPTANLSGTLLSNVSYRALPGTGADIAISMKDLYPFRLSLADNPTRLVVEVARTGAFSTTSDLMTQPSGTATPDTPIYYAQDGDIWSFANGSATNLTKSPEAETDFSVSPSAKQIVFCRVEAGGTADDALAASSLWSMGLDGSNPQELAAPGRTCAEPTVSADGKTVAFTVDEGSFSPPRLSIYTVPLAGGDANRLSSSTDEWSRYGAQWLDNGRLIYAARAEDSRSTLFLNTSGTEEDVGAELTVGSTYSALGEPLAAPNGTSIAVTATRSDGSGTSLLVLDTNGAKVDEISDGYWVRPLAWNPAGSLFYLVTACPSNVAQSYTLIQRDGNGQSRAISAGTTIGAFGNVVATNAGLAYVALERATPGIRGPLELNRQSASKLWFWDVSRGPRSPLVEAKTAITDLGR